MKYHRLLFLLLLAATMPALAATPPTWHSVAGSSTIDWTAHWQGNPVKGGFKQFTIRAQNLVPTHPAGATLSMQLDTTSITASSPDITNALRGAAWFAVKQHPQATFTGTVKHGTNGLKADGRLELKGHQQPLSFPLQVRRKGDGLLLEGHFDLRRTDFGIGAGQWRSGKVVARDVQVRFSVLMNSGTGK